MKLVKLIPSLGVADIQRSIEFYKRYFGFEVRNKYEPDGRLVWCHLKSGTADLMLQEILAENDDKNPHDRRCWVMYVSPADIFELHQKLVAEAHTVSAIADTSYGTKEFYLNDPDGYEIWVSHPCM